MSGLSDERVKRWFKKSASEQYLHAKSLTPQERSELEQALEQRFRSPEEPQAGDALAMWLSVQQARLRTHSPDQQAAYRTQLLTQVALPAATVLGVTSAATMLFVHRRDYYALPERPEYRVAHENFLRVIGDESLHMNVRMTVAQRLAYHARREGTLTFSDSSALQQAGSSGWMQHLGHAIPQGEPHVQEVAGAFALAGIPRVNSAPSGAQPIGSLEQDLALQGTPLGEQMKAWLTAAVAPGLPNGAAFDDEPLAHSFARLLARRQPSQEAGAADAGPLLQDGAMVIHAIAQDPDLRRKVFSMAENALGTCGDNVAEGFSSIVRTVRTHQMVAWVEQGRVGAGELDRWTRQQFRLDVLEREVHRFLGRTLEQTETALGNNRQAMRKAWKGGQFVWNRSNLARLATERAGLKKTKHRVLHEPVETMIHAKVQLGRRLDLPDGLPKAMAYHTESVLTPGDLNSIADAIQAQEADTSALKAFFLASEDVWLAGMKKLHADKLKPIWDDYENHSIWDEELPPQDVEFAAQQDAYSERVAAIRREAKMLEADLLFKLAGLP